MTRLIDADRLIKVIEKAQFEGRGNIMSIINDAPTVDTDLSGYSKRLWKAAYERGKKEKQQGEWIKEDKLWGGFGDRVLVLTCSECGKSFIYRGNNPKFCSECGADMREEA